MSSEFEIVRLRTAAELEEELASDVRRGFASVPKKLPPKYFYDERGSQLFEEITHLPEYYLTRAELSILERLAAELVGSTKPDEMLEIGGGYSRKTELLLAPFAAAGGQRYLSLDVSEDALRSAGARLGAAFPDLAFTGIVGDLGRDLPRIERRGTRLILFLGSTIGNLEGANRAAFLSSVAAEMQAGDRFLVGCDLVKDTARLEAAYDDPAGVTAAFNKNVLAVLNERLDGDLPLDAFRHRAFYDEGRERIDIRLVAEREVRARLAALDLAIVFEAGEELSTEISCKFTRPGVEADLSAAGLRVERWATDEAGDFALVLAALS